MIVEEEGPVLKIQDQRVEEKKDGNVSGPSNGIKINKEIVNERKVGRFGCSWKDDVQVDWMFDPATLEIQYTQPQHILQNMNGPLRLTVDLRVKSSTENIAFTINKLAQFLHKPTILHWQSTKHLLRYLKHTVDFGLQFHKLPSLSLQAYSDADWAGSRDDRCSTGGYYVFLAGNLISWSCKK
ncbi:uncharacterized protein LOC131148439 [Malania oleifera]|uniref:uncharacterized protein LOC131148439 n=1 Tax=Malania oleifera TaxID=397392 RepID=UPI0025ADF3CF|nr:uncharacterized protein LOC131148439 [Malania oleifera]